MHFMANQEKQKKEIKELLRLHYNFNSFRAGQEQAIDNVLKKRSSVVIMPTGGGKSLCFQLPALVLDGVTIVISPLIALMKDQVDNLTKLGIPATFVNSTISLSETEERLKAVQDGAYKLLYIAPERFYNQEFTKALEGIKVSLFAVDEAHCISQWGHDFRPSYLKLKEAIELVGQPPIMALTATATPEVREDIIKQLEINDRDLIITGFARPNLQLGVIHATEARKPSLTLDAVSSAPDEPGIIYVGTRARADALLQYLLENNIEAVGYHAGMDSQDRKWVQQQFMRGEAKVIVATNAFGLGIDKANIRFVIHYDMPGTVEAYYQEAGRAGRDALPSFCLLLYNSRDRALHEFFIKGDNPPPFIIREIYDILLNYDTDTVLITYAELSDMLSDNAPDMAVGTALKILEKEGYIARTREKSGNAFLKLNKDINYILDIVGQRAKKQNEVLSKLNERYGNELVKGWQFLPDEVAGVLEINREPLMRLVRKLKDLGLAEYYPPFKGTEIRVLKRVNPRDLEFDEAAMKAKLKAAYQKLDKIEDYVFDLGCRQKFILGYFGDSEARVCGKCDICVTGPSLARSRIEKTLPKKKAKTMVARPPREGSGLSTKLTQLETLELFNRGESIEAIAQARELKPTTIVNHLCFLIDKKLIKDISRLVDKTTEMKIKKAIKKMGDDKLKPIYLELKERIDYDKIKLVVAKTRSKNP